MKIDVEYLIGYVQECFYDETNFRTTKAKRGSQERRHIYDVSDCHWRNFSDFCRIFSIDQTRMITIARLARKWEMKRGWERCFPARKLGERILAYVAKEA